MPTMESIHHEITQMRRDIELIKNILAENYELSDEAKKELKSARHTPESKYVDLE